MYKRFYQMDLPSQRSAFLWGAKQTGKTCFLKEQFRDAVYYDLLNLRHFIKFTKSPDLFREEILALSATALSQPIIVDEIQKVPELLNEVHWLIENTKAQFILCGSSARKLKTSVTNLLGGRAWIFKFYPLVFPEIPDFDLLRALQHGLIPNHYQANPNELQNNLEAYIDVYLNDEIKNEALVRNLAGFAKFLDVAGMCNGEMINFTNIARDCGIDRATVQGYYQILVDTLLGDFISPYQKKIKRDLIHATSKFYLFDIGVANYLAKQQMTALKGSVAGKSFEHFILMELKAYLGLKRKRLDITYWRTKTGLEVDFIVGNAAIAIEVKISEQVHQKDLKGLIAFCEEHPKAKAIVISQDTRPRLLQVQENLAIHVLPWKTFLTQLWDGEIL